MTQTKATTLVQKLYQTDNRDIKNGVEMQGSVHDKKTVHDTFQPQMCYAKKTSNWTFEKQYVVCGNNDPNWTAVFYINCQWKQNSW